MVLTCRRHIGLALFQSDSDFPCCIELINGDNGGRSSLQKQLWRLARLKHVGGISCRTLIVLLCDLIILSQSG